MNETRTTSATGGVKGVKLAQFNLIPVGALTELAEHYGRGAQKYPASPGDVDNWCKGYEWSKSYAALQRHATKFWGGEDVDPDNGSKHLIAVAWHAFAMATWMDDPALRQQFDDRPSTIMQGRLF